MAHLELHGVSVALGRRDVVREVSAQVDAGELVVIVGPNGAGKTTLLTRAAFGVAILIGQEQRAALWGRE
jgi:ABC-type cobalamin/Fe3+-siderophores transport system ATPase subunit